MNYLPLLLLAALKLHPDNPHYLLDTKTGRAILIAGYGSIVPSSEGYDYVVGVEELGAWRVPYARVWHLLPWDGTAAIWPWDNQTGVPSPYLGRDAFDFNTWNPNYWRRLKDSIARAEALGVIAEPHLFDRCGMSPASADRWENNPWAADNNINAFEVPGANEDGTPEFYLYASKPNLRAAQERYVRKFVDETIQFENVIYEIENEHWELADPDFGDHYASLIKEYIATNYPDSPRLVSYNSLDDDLEAFYQLPSIDIVNKHYGAEPENDPNVLREYLRARWAENKAINIDEFANGVTDPALLRRMAWTIVTSGGHFHIEDAALEARPFELVENIRHFLERSGWDFVHARPIETATGTCMAQDGVEYVCWYAFGGTKPLNLAAGTYRAAVWNARAGGFDGEREVRSAGGEETFEVGSESVLFVSARPRPELRLTAKWASDWTHASVRAVRGGEPGSGDRAEIGVFDGVTWSGGHSTEQQYPPVGIAAVIRVRHDADAIYVRSTGARSLSVYIAGEELSGVELTIAKNAFSPPLPRTGTVAIDFVVDSSLSWSDPEVSDRFPSANPARWGTLELAPEDAPLPAPDAGVIGGREDAAISEDAAAIDVPPAPEVGGTCRCDHANAAGAPTALLILCVLCAIRSANRR